jgi:hypothetical protein
VQAPQVRGVEEPLLPEPRGVKGGATQGQGALERQKRHHPRLHKATRIRGLDVCAEISNFVIVVILPKYKHSHMGFRIFVAENGTAK